MKISITIIYKSNGNKVSQQASFPVNSKRFKEDPHTEAARVTYEWLKEIKKEMSYSVEIDNVVYSGDNDITELVKQLDDDPLPDDNLPF